MGESQSERDLSDMESEQDEEEGADQSKQSSEYAEQRKKDLQEHREREKQRKYQSLFLNGKILEEKIRATMSKYGLREMDEEVIEMVSNAMKLKYTNMLTDLIEISRSHHSAAYLSQKQSLPLEVTQIHAFNLSGRDAQKRPSEIAKFELMCTTNTQLEMKSILEVEAHKKDERRQKMLEDMSGTEESKDASKEQK